MTVPVPRKPMCYSHSIWHAGCSACAEQRRTDKEAARERLKQAAK